MTRFPYPTSLEIANARATFAQDSGYPFPDLVPVRQKFPSDSVADVRAETASQLSGMNCSELNGKRIAVAAGSRGISGMTDTLAATVDYLKSVGADPFVVPAMGSHGGATAEGQRAVLASLGITEESVGAPIRSSMEVVEIGELDGKTPVCCDRYAFESDGIIVCNRIKSHPAFEATYESGLLKMMLIGLGKHVGTTAAHKLGFGTFQKIIPTAAEMMMNRAPILFGIGIVENAFGGVAKVAVIPKNEIMDREKELLVYSKRIMGKLLIPEIDVLVVDALGKDVSGSGMDANVTGRAATGLKRDYAPDVAQIVIRDLTDATKGNAVGMGMSDIMTRRAAEKVNLGITYTNTITARTIASTKIPLIAETDREAIEIACRIAVPDTDNPARLVQISDTKKVHRIWMSVAYLPEIDSMDDLELDGEPEAMRFDEEGNQIWPTRR